MEYPASDMATDTWVSTLTQACQTERVYDAERGFNTTRRITPTPRQLSAYRSCDETDLAAFLTDRIRSGRRRMPQHNPEGANADAESDGGSGRDRGRGRGRSDSSGVSLQPPMAQLGSQGPVLRRSPQGARTAWSRGIRNIFPLPRVYDRSYECEGTSRTVRRAKVRRSWRVSVCGGTVDSPNWLAGFGTNGDRIALGEVRCRVTFNKVRSVLASISDEVAS